LHPDPYCSKFKPLARERNPQIRGTLAQQCRDCAACSAQFQFRGPRVDDGNMFRQRRRQRSTDAILQRGFAPMALQQVVECGFAFKYLLESAHGTVSAKRSATEVRGRTPREILI
jgi:hypothetical protein